MKERNKTIKLLKRHNSTCFFKLCLECFSFVIFDTSFDHSRSFLDKFFRFRKRNTEKFFHYFDDSNLLLTNLSDFNIESILTSSRSIIRRSTSTSNSSSSSSSLPFPLASRRPETRS